MVITIEVLDTMPLHVISTPEPLMYLYNDIKKKYKHNEFYAIGFKYIDNSIQFGITGTLSKNETPYDGMIREVAEECGLKVKPLNIQLNQTKKKSNYFQKWWTHHFHIDNIYSYYLPTENKNTHDLKHLKVGCIIYGSKDSLCMKLNKLILFNFKSSDNICSILIFPIKWFEQCKVYNFITN